ncbi:MAG: hypothetical protein U0S12_09210 [Fimbriimonadales bacterium]
MSNWKEGDRVRVVTREVTAEDRNANRYFSHMAGVVGTVQNVYGKDEIAIKVDPSSLSPISADVHRGAIERMRERFASGVSEEQKKQLTAEELNFTANYVLLCRGEDLEAL